MGAVVGPAGADIHLAIERGETTEGTEDARRALFSFTVMRMSAGAAVMLLWMMGCESFTEVLGPISYTAALSGTAVKPTAVTTDATGTLTAALDRTTLQWSYTVGWQSLSSAPTNVHLHGPADAAGVADVLADLHDGDTELTPTSSATGVLDFSVAVTPLVSGDSVRKLLNAGQVYVDVHTVNNTNGEIRGQLVSH